MKNVKIINKELMKIFNRWEFRILYEYEYENKLVIVWKIKFDL